MADWEAKGDVYCDRHRWKLVMDNEGLVRHLVTGTLCDVVPKRRLGAPATPKPEYSKQDVTTEGHATKQWAIRVREPGRNWILCTGMYEWAADQLLARLNASLAGWDHP